MHGIKVDELGIFYCSERGTWMKVYPTPAFKYVWTLNSITWEFNGIISKYTRHRDGFLGYIY